MSDLIVPGFEASKRITAMASAITALSDKEKRDLIKKTKGIFEFQIKNADGNEQVWTIDMKKDGHIYKGRAQPKCDVTIIVSDETRPRGWKTRRSNGFHDRQAKDQG